MIFYLGTPKIRSLTKHRTTDGKHKILTCEAEGSPQPDVIWSVNGTNVSHRQDQDVFCMLIWLFIDYKRFIHRTLESDVYGHCLSIMTAVTHQMMHGRLTIVCGFG